VRRKARDAALGTLMLMLSACAGPVFLGKYAYAAGWREAVVTEIGPHESLDHAWKDCAAATAEGPFARLRFQYARNLYTMIVAVPKGVSLQPGESVLVNSNDCRAELVVAEPG
jgi:hypothetical protein